MTVSRFTVGATAFGAFVLLSIPAEAARKRSKAPARYGASSAQQVRPDGQVQMQTNVTGGRPSKMGITRYPADRVMSNSAAGGNANQISRRVPGGTGGGGSGGSNN